MHVETTVSRAWKCNVNNAGRDMSPRSCVRSATVARVNH